MCVGMQELRRLRYPRVRTLDTVTLMRLAQLGIPPESANVIGATLLPPNSLLRILDDRRRVWVFLSITFLFPNFCFLCQLWILQLHAPHSESDCEDDSQFSHPCMFCRWNWYLKCELLCSKWSPKRWRIWSLEVNLRRLSLLLWMRFRRHRHCTGQENHWGWSRVTSLQSRWLHHETQLLRNSAGFLMFVPSFMVWIHAGQSGVE